MRLNLADDSGNIRVKFKSAKADAKKMGHVTNGAWRDGKGKAYEGGHRVPFIARWPERIKPGSVSSCTFNLTDLFATAADIVKREIPVDAGEDSISLLPVLLGKQDHIADREAIFVLGNGKDSAIAVCTGRWKLIVRYGDEEDRGHELYDLENDPGELTDLSDQSPEVMQHLLGAFNEAESAGQTRK